MYAQTRGINDVSYMKSQTVTQTRPLRYMTEQLTDRAIKFVHPESIDDSTHLRMRPTRLNQIDRDQCDLYGTAPYKMGRVASDVDIESTLRFSNNLRMNQLGKTITEKSFQFVDDVHVSSFMNVVDNDTRSRSTRVDQRNQQGQNMNC